MRPNRLSFLAVLTALVACLQACGVPAGNWADWVEPGFPYFSSAVDARGSGGVSPTNNLTPRAVVVRLGPGHWGAYDVDLLRWSAVWEGTNAVTPVSMSQGSYHEPGVKAPAGQERLPQPAANLALASAVLPGWLPGREWVPRDPRPLAPDPREVGRGPLPSDWARFDAIRQVGDGVVLEYRIESAAVRERLSAGTAREGRWMERRLWLGPGIGGGWLLLGRAADGGAPRLVGDTDGMELRTAAGGDVWLFLGASRTDREVAVAWGPGRPETSAPADRPPERRWPEVVVTTVEPGSTAAEDPVAVDHFPPPSGNPWRRNVRLADIDFQADGTAFLVTFDGDVWRVSGLAGDSGRVEWRRWASGLHEPMSLVVRRGEVCVFDRNGIWRLLDRDGNGEADIQARVSNAFAQTAETREFATSMGLLPEGSFVVAKGGQQSSTLGIHNGTVLRVPADGSPAEVLGWGFRMPFVGVNPRTGMVTASDQQGHHVPSTPLYEIRGAGYHGFLSERHPPGPHPAPIEDPLAWIPHPVNASGMTQLWLEGARMGDLDGALLHFGYYRPEVFLVRLGGRGVRAQAAVMSLTRDLRFPAAAGAVHPVDGLPYLTGFQIWGTEAPQVSGLARLRRTGGMPPVPREVATFREGVLIRFDDPLDPAAATDPDRYSVELWNYRRTAAYGSPSFRRDGTRGREAPRPSSTYLSRDRRSVLVGIPGLTPVMQLRIGWRLRTASGREFAASAYLSPVDLPRFEPEREGFGPLAVDLSPRGSGAPSGTVPATPDAGREVAALMGCTACHSDDGTTVGRVGPTWRGLWGAERRMADGARVRADPAYLRESILDPDARKVAGFEGGDVGMPPYDGVLSSSQIEALLAYLESLR